MRGKKKKVIFNFFFLVNPFRTSALFLKIVFVNCFKGLLIFKANREVEPGERMFEHDCVIASTLEFGESVDRDDSTLFAALLSFCLFDEKKLNLILLRCCLTRSVDFGNDSLFSFVFSFSISILNLGSDFFLD